MRIRVALVAAVGLAALVLAPSGRARAGEAPPDEIPAVDEEPPVVEPAPETTGPAEPAEPAKEPPAPEIRVVPGPPVGPAPAVPGRGEEPLPDIWGPEEERAPEWVEQTIARDTRMRLKYVRTFQAEAIQALRAHRYETAIEACKKAQAIDPENLSIQRLRYLAERKLQEHRLKLEAELSVAADEEALADVDLKSRFPAEVPPEPRPKLPLREEMAEPEASRRMQELLGQRVSMNFVEADLDYVLQTLFKIANVNIIADQSVVADKTLSLHVENVPLREILDFIKRNYEGVDYTVTESAVLITSPEKPPLFPKSYPLSRGLIGQQEFSTGVRRTQGGQTGGIGGLASSALNRGTLGRSGRAAAGGGASGAGGGVSAGGESYLESVLTWVESWENEWPQGSQWYLDRQTNTLFVLTTAEMHKRMGEILDVIDTVPIQVLVQTRFIEVLSDDLREFGVSSINYMEWTERKLIDPTTGEEGSLPEGTMVNMVDMGTSSGGLQVSMGKFLTNTSQIMAALNALERKQRTKVLSAPHVIALNNTAATIDISKTFSYASQYQSSLGTSYLQGGQTLQNASAFIPSQFDEVQVGFLLEFVPSVGRDHENIVLDLHARVDDVVGNIEDFQSSPIIMPTTTEEGGTPVPLPTGSQAIQRPVIDSREFRTRLVVKDGGTVVLGGLLKNYREKTKRKVPILGDIPLLGLLFRYEKDWVKQSNLIIVVTAQIVKPDGGRYADSGDAATATPQFGMQSFGSAPKSNEWVRDLAPELERDVLGRDRR